MDVSYNKLWKLMIDHNIKKGELQSAAKLSSSTMSKLKNGLNVQMDVLVRICRVLECDLSDIMELLPPSDTVLPGKGIDGDG